MDKTKETEKLSSKDNLEIVAKAGIASIPVVGAALSTIYFDRKQAKEFHRLAKFYEELSYEINNIKDRIIPIEKQYEDGVISLMEQVNDKIEKEHQNEKVQAYKNYMKSILTNNITEYNYDKSKIFLDILNNMNLLEIDVITLLWQKHLENRNHIIKVGAFKRDGFDTYVFVGAISKLRSYGFIKTQQQEMTFGGVEDNLLNEWVSITDFGIEFINFVLK